MDRRSPRRLAWLGRDERTIGFNLGLVLCAEFCGCGGYLFKELPVQLWRAVPDLIHQASGERAHKAPPWICPSGTHEFECPLSTSSSASIGAQTRSHRRS